jgi:hypothetical protein
LDETGVAKLALLELSVEPLGSETEERESS